MSIGVLPSNLPIRSINAELRGTWLMQDALNTYPEDCVFECRGTYRQPCDAGFG